MADLIVNKENSQLPLVGMPSGFSNSGVQGGQMPDGTTALGTVTLEAMQCFDLTPGDAERYAISRAKQVLAQGLHDSHVSLITLKEVVARMATIPGQRIIVLTSPGFLPLTGLLWAETDIEDLAVKSNVVSSSLDARGLYVLSPAGEINEKSFTPDVMGAKFRYRRQEVMADDGVLEEMAYGTGGTFIQNTNDFDGAFRKLASAPEFVYVLGYTPDTLKSDGKFHALTVKLNSPGKLSVQARHGYFAPRAGDKPEDVAKQEIADAVFGRYEISELPFELHTQFFKTSETAAKLTVMASVNLQQVTLRKDQGRNSDDLTVVSAVFDNDGNFVAGVQKLIELRLKDETARRLQAGRPISVKMPFDVHPGKYAIRLVVRDAGGNRLSAQNGEVEIP
jgi:hypothetical protein